MSKVEPPLPEHWKKYLQMFDKFLLSSSPLEARVQRRRMDDELTRALARHSVTPRYDSKHPSSLEGDGTIRVQRELERDRPRPQLVCPF